MQTDFDRDDHLQTVREIVRDTIAPLAEEVDDEGRWPAEGIRALQKAGLGGLVIPKTKGGLGLGLLGLIRACEEIGRACASTALCFGMHCVGSAVIAAKSTQSHQSSYLDPICRGEHLTTLALSEPGSGSHFYFPQTRLEKLDGTYRLVGKKVFVTNGGHADSYVLSTVAADPMRPVGEFSCIVVPHGTEGMTWGPEWRGLGMRGNSSRSLDLDGVHVNASDLLGREGEQIWYIFQVVAPYFLGAMAGTYLGIAAASLDTAIKHVKGRHYAHSGSDLERIQIVQHRIGTLWTYVERTRQLIYLAGAETDAGGDRALPALCAAKADVAECAVHVVNEAMSLAGGQAYRDGSSLWRHMRDARAAHVMGPTTDVLYTWIGRVLLDLPILEGS